MLNEIALAITTRPSARRLHRFLLERVASAVEADLGALRLQTEEGLAAVMGHEMAHAIARHGSQRLLQTTLAQTVMTGAQLSFSDMDWNQRRMILAALGAGAQYGVLLPFSRHHETEADEMGIIYMARAGYDPEAAISFWQRMQQESGGAQQPPEFASTHPSGESRIAHLREIMPRAQAEYAKVAARR